MDIEITDLVNNIIPPNDYKHRRDFNNVPMLEQLSNSQKDLVVEALIEKLRITPADVLIIDTLSYLRAVDAVPVLYTIVETQSGFTRLAAAAAVFSMNGDSNMRSVAIVFFNGLTDKYAQIPAFYYLAAFDSEATDTIIKKYIDSKDVLLASNAKRSLSGRFV